MPFWRDFILVVVFKINITGHENVITFKHVSQYTHAGTRVGPTLFFPVPPVKHYVVIQKCTCNWRKNSKQKIQVAIKKVRNTGNQIFFLLTKHGRVFLKDLHLKCREINLLSVTIAVKEEKHQALHECVRINGSKTIALLLSLKMCDVWAHTFYKLAFSSFSPSDHK